MNDIGNMWRPWDKLTPQQRLKREENGLYAIYSRPLILHPKKLQFLGGYRQGRDETYLQDVKAYRATVDIDVGMEAGCIEFDSRCDVWVIRREGYGDSVR